MHTIERTDFGLHVRIAGTNSAAQMQQYVRDLGDAMRGLARGWHAVIDLREAKVLAGDASAQAVGAQRAMREQGMERIAVVLASAIVALQNRQLSADGEADRAQSNPGLRVFNASDDPNALREALAWARSGIEPAKRSTR